MKNLFFALVILVSVLIFTACTYNKAELLNPPTTGGCDTSATISYTAKVLPILNTKCYSCHIGAGAGGGIIMGTHASDKVIAVNGLLYGSINHSPGFSKMPKNEPKMSVCDIAIIKKWIDAGSPNN
jgi:hypothetical protein